MSTFAGLSQLNGIMLCLTVVFAANYFFYTLGGLKATIVHGCVYEARIIYGICFISS